MVIWLPAIDVMCFNLVFTIFRLGSLKIDFIKLTSNKFNFPYYFYAYPLINFIFVYLHFSLFEKWGDLNIVSILIVDLDKASKQEITKLERLSSKTPTSYTFRLVPFCFP